MKRILLLLLVGASLTCPVLAQDAPSTPPPHGGPGGPGGFMGMRNLTPDERKQVIADREAALKANPDLAAREKELRDKMMALQKDIDAAMIAADPSVAPILAKMHADGPPHKHKDNGDSTPPANGDDSTSGGHSSQ